MRTPFITVEKITIEGAVTPAETASKAPVAGLKSIESCRATPPVQLTAILTATELFATNCPDTAYCVAGSEVGTICETKSASPLFEVKVAGMKPASHWSAATAAIAAPPFSTQVAAGLNVPRS